LQEGQEIEVFVAGVDKQGRVKLEWKDKPQAAVAAVEEEADVADANNSHAEEE
jgi:polyribonucleotide nucleotidyltransferase